MGVRTPHHAPSTQIQLVLQEVSLAEGQVIIYLSTELFVLLFKQMNLTKHLALMQFNRQTVQREQLWRWIYVCSLTTNLFHKYALQDFNIFLLQIDQV